MLCYAILGAAPDLAFQAAVVAGRIIFDATARSQHAQPFSHSKYSSAIQHLDNNTANQDFSISGHISDLASPSPSEDNIVPAFVDLVEGSQNDQGRSPTEPWVGTTISPVIVSPGVQHLYNGSPSSVRTGFDAATFTHVQSPTQNRPTWTSPLAGLIPGSTPEHVSGYSLSPTARITPSVLKNELESKVFEFYIVYMGHWLDIGSPKHYFQSHIPQLAVREPLVLYACLACAAQIMFLMGILDRSIEEQYNGKVLEILIPLLSSNMATSANEVLLATTVILRMAEQFLELGQDAQRHLNGAASLFMDGTDWPLAEHNLGIAAFWTHLRETTRICFLHEQPPQFDLAQLNINDSLPDSAAPEEVWTNKMTYLLLKVCKSCWGTCSGDLAIAGQLHASLDLWKENVPPSYRPWLVRETEEHPFPVIKYFEPWHVVAWQFYYTAKVMLAVYYSNKQQAGNVHWMRNYIESEIVSPTRLLCGLCMSSNNIGTNLNGSHLMAWCGQYFSGQKEQTQLLEFLTKFGEKTKWPNQTSSKRLQEQWRSSRRSWVDC
ncbi:hypothetical protein LTR84_003040 [Exophiala bonariae]|uniref:Transcription factor domain-containing protein n=1 Tax=Exophiala bonariae TaxID=1690606 RepID=A0AAV9N8J8_9EURO|nr:hypothetical protein LTR84_003040 [Exophiala bonariae]